MDRQKILEYHKGGKTGTQVKKPVETREELSIAYTPGVAEVCGEIKQDNEKAYDYTNKGNSVAVITNGTAVLGLGNIGVLASKPVMEGKSVLFKKFGDVDATDVLVDTAEIEKFVEAVKLIFKGYGGINLEDVKSPECFEIEKRLRKELDIPVFHDDQHGTAIVTGAGLLNALKVAGKKIGEVKIVINGAGAAGIACVRLFLELGVNVKNVFMFDREGVITKTHKEDHKREFGVDEIISLEGAMEGADVFVGVSAGNVVTAEMIKSMAENPIVFAMANPEPEIRPEIAHEARKDVIMATGRSDYPNQINNVLAFPFIFRGALDVRARGINETMKMAAAKALAGAVKEIRKDQIIPDIFDKRAGVEVAFAVAKAAVESGVAQKKIDLGKYREELEKRIG